MGHGNAAYGHFHFKTSDYVADFCYHFHVLYTGTVIYWHIGFYFRLTFSNMAKRSATSELNHDNWNDEEEPEDAGSFQQASAEVLQKRVIRQAKRKLGGSTGEEKANVFAGFSGFGSSAPKPAASLFSFLGQNSTPSTNTEKKFENGSIKPSATDENKNEPEYLASLRDLNEAVTSWVSEHVKKNPCCVLTPIFQDYEKHLKGLEEKRKTKNAEMSTSSLTDKDTPSKEPVGAKFSFGKALEASNTNLVTPAKTDSEKTEPPKFEFGKVQTTSAPALNLFSSSTSSSSLTTSSTFSFGSSTGTTPFSFGSSTAPAAPFSFGFGSTNKPLAPVAEKKEDEDKEGNEDDEDSPPKQEIKKVEEDDAFYSIRCKLFYKKGNSYAEKGVGTLFLKKSDEKTQLVVRAETSLGNILLNIFLNPQLSTQRVGKNNVMLVCIPNPPIDPKTPAVPTPMLFRVKTEDEADDLLQKLNDAKK